MKRITALALILLLLLPIMVSAAVDLDSLTNDELLSLYNNTVEKLKQRSIYPYIELKSGASGDEVANLQRRLVELGYLKKEPTGKFDSTTVAALKAFEKAHSLKQDGIASVDDQKLVFDPMAIAKPVPTPDISKTYGKFDFNQVARYPDENKGKKLKVIGRVIQVLGDRKGGFELRVATKGRYDNIIYIYTLGNHSANILEGDRITFYCVMEGDYTYESTLGQSITLPLARADSYE